MTAVTNYALQPFSSEEPSARDHLLSRQLEEYLRQAQPPLYESDEDAETREAVMGHLNVVVKTWVQGVAHIRGFEHSVCEEANARIFVFGSYRLGVHGPGADIDTLCVAPSWVTRETDFFGTEKHSLQYMLSMRPDVTEMQPVPDAVVPVLSCKFMGVSLDILFAPIKQFRISDSLDIRTNAVLRAVDDATVKSLNGCRVTDALLSIVPNPTSFKLALRALRHWAAVRGLYSNVMGFFGGINVAILVAKICQWYPKASAATVVHAFFMMWSSWKWPTAVHLCVPAQESLGLPVWSPLTDHRDAAALMPIITPAYPAQNSSYNVSRSTLEVIKEEFSRGYKICAEIATGTCTAAQPADWARLFEPVNFFDCYQFYVQIEVVANSAEDLTIWDGWVNSRIRNLVRGVEDHANVRPFPQAQKCPFPAEDGRPRKYYYMAIFARTMGPQVAGAPAKSLRSVHLAAPVQQFNIAVKAWQSIKPGMDVKVNLLKAAALPGWLWPTGVNPRAPVAVADPAAVADAAAGAESAAAADPTAVSASATGMKAEGVDMVSVKAEALGQEAATVKQEEAVASAQQALKASPTGLGKAHAGGVGTKGVAAVKVEESATHIKVEAETSQLLLNGVVEGKGSIGKVKVEESVISASKRKREEGEDVPGVTQGTGSRKSPRSQAGVAPSPAVKQEMAGDGMDSKFEGVSGTAAPAEQSPSAEDGSSPTNKQVKASVRSSPRLAKMPSITTGVPTSQPGVAEAASSNAAGATASTTGAPQLEAGAAGSSGQPPPGDTATRRTTAVATAAAAAQAAANEAAATAAAVSASGSGAAALPSAKEAAAAPGTSGRGGEKSPDGRLRGAKRKIPGGSEESTPEGDGPTLGPTVGSPKQAAVAPDAIDQQTAEAETQLSAAAGDVGDWLVVDRPRGSAQVQVPQAAPSSSTAPPSSTAPSPSAPMAAASAATAARAAAPAGALPTAAAPAGAKPPAKPPVKPPAKKMAVRFVGR